MLQLESKVCYTHIKAFKRRAGLAIDKWLWVISNKMFFKAVSYTAKLKDKAVLS